MVDADTLREALSRFASGVLLATARDRSGAPRGFTATAFSAVSLSPPLVLVCLNAKAECYDVFQNTEWFGLSFLRFEQKELALRLATRGADKFGQGGFVDGPRLMPLAAEALATMVCRKDREIVCGDHSILVGQVEYAHVSQYGDALVHFQRAFLSSADLSNSSGNPIRQ